MTCKEAIAKLEKRLAYLGVPPDAEESIRA
jgi:hypothetical protein